jgi:hypothetical protein
MTRIGRKPVEFSEIVCEIPSSENYQHATAIGDE